MSSHHECPSQGLKKPLFPPSRGFALHSAHRGKPIQSRRHYELNKQREWPRRPGEPASNMRKKLRGLTRSTRTKPREPGRNGNTRLEAVLTQCFGRERSSTRAGRRLPPRSPTIRRMPSKMPPVRGGEFSVQAHFRHRGGFSRSTQKNHMRSRSLELLSLDRCTPTS
jgi:hypothetical protein